ncbi:MAG: molybdopterin dinucleotide binding domain protein [Methanosaeta sp. PtaU1.Bin112]|nr:MAG: molybdopterin dinucleotide binding domain protein [Methanosaeta sp. PtaU1.Bin112]
MAEVEVVVVAVRDIFQDEAGRKSLFSEEYKSLSALIILDKQDMAGLAVKDGDKLLAKNDAGSIVVAARASKDDAKEAHPGLAFMCSSPWYNQLVSDDSCQGSVKATLAPTAEAITAISEIQARMKS